MRLGGGGKVWRENSERHSDRKIRQNEGEFGTRPMWKKKKRPRGKKDKEDKKNAKDGETPGTKARGKGIQKGVYVQ